MAITHKGMGKLLAHHALKADTDSDEDVDKVINCAIKNSDEASEDETVMNRAENEELKLKVAELEKKLKAKGAPIHNRNGAGTPEIDLDTTLSTDAAEEKRASLITNRARELTSKGTPQGTAWTIAEREIDSEIKSGIIK